MSSYKKGELIHLRFLGPALPLKPQPEPPTEPPKPPKRERPPAVQEPPAVERPKKINIGRLMWETQ